MTVERLFRILETIMTHRNEVARQKEVLFAVGGDTYEMSDELIERPATNAHGGSFIFSATGEPLRESHRLAGPIHGNQSRAVHPLAT